MLGAVGWSRPLGQEADSPSPVESVELRRYTGLWYEIAKIPNRFQKKCARGTTAFYSLREDGKISVVNRCLDESGKTVRAVGLAKVMDAASNARLKVSFVNVLGVRLFWGDYWIIGLEENYEYAIVGHPKRDYGWILARSPQLTAETLEDIHEQLLSQGYDPDDFVLTAQTAE
jgi:apolipoprotein D and lipocalin family protein